MSDMSSNPHVISVPDPVGAAKPGAEVETATGVRAFIQKFIFSPLAVLALAAVILSSALTGADVTWQEFKQQSASFFADDVVRIERTGRVLPLAVRELRRIYADNPEGLTLAFNQAEIAYYSDVPYISYFDRLALPFFLPQSKEELWSKLRAANVKYLLVPGYALSEVTNTAFEQLLADPSLVEMLFNNDGYRIMRVLEAPNPIEMHLIAREAGETLRLSDWTTSSYGASGPSASVTWADDGILVNVPRRPLKDRQRYEYLYRGDVSNDGAFLAPPGVSTISLDLTGRGRFLLYIQHREGTKIVQTPIWIGILYGERQTISAQFHIDGDRPAPVAFFLGSYRTPPYVLHGWEVRSVAPPMANDADETSVASSEGSSDRPQFAPALTGPDVSVAYIFGREPTNTSAFDYLIRTGELWVRVEVATNAAPVAAIANCADGVSDITLAPASVPNRHESKLPCWPISLSIIWPPSFDARKTDVKLVATSGQESHVLPMVELGAMLDETSH